MAIRKYTKWVDKCGANPKGIRITPNASAFVRTVCSCGFADAAQVYECPNCGNTEFVVCDCHETEYQKFPVEVVVSKSDVSVIQRVQSIYLRQEIEIVENPRSLFAYDGKTVNFNRWNGHEEVFEALRNNKDKLPMEIVDALETMDALGHSNNNRVFSRLLEEHPKTDMFIRMEKDAHPAFTKALIDRVFGGYSSYPDMEFVSMDGFFREYNVPEEFREFVDKCPDEIIRRTIDQRHGGWRRNPSAKFEAPANWNSVPEEIKNVCKYYLENGVISFNTYASLGTIEPAMLKKKAILNLYFKKYMMQFKDRIVSAINATYHYLEENNIAITETTFDEKWCRQKQNIDMLYSTLARSQTDIDAFINYCDSDAVNAIKNLASAKRTKKAKATE